jgi:hypothetical protein
MDFSPQKAESKHHHKERKTRGKRSNPLFEQVTAYIRKDTYLKAKIVVLQEGRDFSELVEDLLSAYLRTQNSALVNTQTEV